MTDIDQHNKEIYENRAAWERKPALRRIYRRLYEEIAAALPREAKGITLELGSGMGNIKEVLPKCITSDIFPNPWLDRVENAYALSFGPRTISNLILFDVWHHLQYPGAALREFRRVLAPGGVVLLMEPATGLLGRAIYGLFHHEPLGLGQRIEWEIPENFDPAKQTYYAAQGNCWRLVRHFRRLPRDQQPAALRDWEITQVKYFPALSYLMSGGFRGPQLYPDAALPALQALENVLAPLPALTAARMLVVLRPPQLD